jgi:7-cyano-7-deazaguanine synthase
MEKTAVVLFSGGIDSTTTLAIAQQDGYTCCAVSFDYGQRHRVELQAARILAKHMGVDRHVIIPFSLRSIGGSSLIDDIAVPKGRDESEMGMDIPNTYVPARNTIFLSFALGLAEVVGAFDIFIGANAVDYSGYPDCRPAYLKAFEQMADLATKAGVEEQGRFKIQAPLIYMSKAEIIQTGVELGVDYSLTHSCYDPAEDGGACGDCDSCRLRRKGFEEAGVVDPTRYADNINF